jgi:hypothetical protein
MAVLCKLYLQLRGMWLFQISSNIENTTLIVNQFRVLVSSVVSYPLPCIYVIDFWCNSIDYNN